MQAHCVRYCAEREMKVTNSIAMKNGKSATTKLHGKSLSTLPSDLGEKFRKEEIFLAVTSILPLTTSLSLFLVTPIALTTANVCVILIMLQVTEAVVTECRRSNQVGSN